MSVKAESDVLITNETIEALSEAIVEGARLLASDREGTQTTKDVARYAAMGAMLLAKIILPSDQEMTGAFNALLVRYIKVHIGNITDEVGQA